MSALTALQSGTSSSQNLATGVSVQGYAASAGRYIRPRVIVASLTGSALTLTIGVRNTTDTTGVLLFSEAKGIATDAGAEFTLPAFIAQAKTYAVTVKSSHASDTSCSVTVDWFDATHADTVALAGTGQTGRDIGASVLLSSGTGTGQVSLSSGTVTAGAISANAISATAIASGAFTSAKFAANALDAVWSTTTRQLTATQAFNNTGTWTGSLSGNVGSISGVTFPTNFSSLAVNASGHVILQDASLTTAKLGTFVLAKTTNISGFNDIAATAIVSNGAIITASGAVTTVTTLTNSPTFDARTIVGYEGFRYVSKTGSDANPGTSRSAPKLTVQAAITAASAGEQVRVSKGTYAENLVAKDGVDLHLDHGVVIAPAANQALVGENVTVRITGDGEFRGVGNVAVAFSDSNLTMEALAVSSTGGDSSGIAIDGGSFAVNIKKWVRAEGYDAAILSSSGNFTCPEVTTTAADGDSNAIELAGNGRMVINVGIASSSTGPAVSVVPGNAPDAWLNVGQVNTTNAVGLVVEGGRITANVGSFDTGTANHATAASGATLSLAGHFDTAKHAGAGTIRQVPADLSGKVLGGGAGTITGTGARVVDGSGNAVMPASAYVAAPTAAQNRIEMDANSTKLQAIVEDTGTTIPAAIDGIESGPGGDLSGPGADSVTIKLWANSPTNTIPLADADVWISTDAAGTNVIAGTLQTNSQGSVTFMLDAGVDYYLWAQKDGSNSIQGQQFTAAAD